MARKYTRYTDEQVLREAAHYIETKNTCTGLAREFHMHQSTVWFHLNKRLKAINPDLYTDFRKIAAIPWRVRSSL